MSFQISPSCHTTKCVPVYKLMNLQKIFSVQLREAMGLSQRPETIISPGLIKGAIVGIMFHENLTRNSNEIFTSATNDRLLRLF